MIRLPRNISQFQLALKKAIESYSKNPATNSNKLNEATAKALGFPNYDTLSGAANKPKPTQASMIDKRQRFIGSYNIPLVVVQFLHDEIDKLTDLTGSDCQHIIEDWLNDLDICAGFKLIVSDPKSKSRAGSLFSDIDRHSVQIKLFANRTNIGKIKHEFSKVDITDHKELLARCKKYMRSVGFENTNPVFFPASKEYTLADLCKQLSFSSPIQQVMLAIYLEDLLADE